MSKRKILQAEGKKFQEKGSVTVYCWVRLKYIARYIYLVDLRRWFDNIYLKYRDRRIKDKTACYS